MAGFFALVFSWSVFANSEGPIVIEEGKKVKLNYAITVDGEVADTTEGREPLEFLYEEGAVIPGFYNEIRGLQTGDRKQFIVQPEDGFGASDAGAILEVPREEFSEHAIEVGMMVMAGGEGMPLKAVIKEVREKTVLLDFNHPLAGKMLHFYI